MSNTLDLLPAEFWVVIALLVVGFFWSTKNIKQGIGIPVAAVLATIAVWYVVDVLYNDYEENYMRLFPSEVLTEAWWQVIVFLAAFLLLSHFLHRWINKRYLRWGSQARRMIIKGVHDPYFQRNLTILFRMAFVMWIILLIGAAFRYRENFVYFLFPYLGKHPGPWVTVGLGGGIDAFLALANYLHMMVGAVFGVVAALSTNTGIRRLALLGVLISWPHYVFDRTRGFILIVVMPGLLSWVFLRIRGGVIKKLVILAVFFFVVNAWFGFIIGHRLSGVSITDTFMEKGIDFSESSRERHQGLNMFEELSWITLFTSDGQFTPNIGANYFANLVNPIPRFLWPSKPTIGLDYAVARGMGGAATATGVYATLSNGLIGQGVVNFGLYFGACFAAILMSLWTCWLARIDLIGNKIGYLPLYALGLIITFTLGRDITFINLYPFVFGYAISWWLNRRFVRQRRYLNNNYRS